MNATVPQNPAASLEATPRLIVTCPSGVEDLLLAECRRLGLTDGAPKAGAVVFEAPADHALNYAAAVRICLYSRIASRVLWPLASFACPDAQTLKAVGQTIAFEKHLAKNRTFAVRCVRGEGALHHTKFAALCLKDAVVDRLRDVWGQRPDVDAFDPDVLLDLRLRGGVATVSVDLFAGGLHRRGYRLEGGLAPLKENLAAAMLMRSGVVGPQQAPKPLYDPMCGSATLLVEAAGILAGCAPGLSHPRPPGDRWLGFDATIYKELHAEATSASEAGWTRLRASGWRAVGIDRDDRQLRVAQKHLEQAGLEDLISLFAGEFETLAAHASGAEGLVVANLPYGQRLTESEAGLMQLYGRLGVVLRPLKGFEAHLLIGEEESGQALGVRAHGKHTLYNGPLRCTLLHFHLGQSAPALSPDAQALTNRLAKNLQRLERAGLTRLKGDGCFRLYDAELPQYAAAVDVWTPMDPKEPSYAVVQEYAAPKALDPARCRRHLRQLCRAVSDVLRIDPKRIVLKMRRRSHAEPEGVHQTPIHMKKHQEPTDATVPHFWVQEGDLRFWVELDEKIDCGLFMDHRPLRKWLARHSQGRDVLNLFGYTGSLSVAAAKGGATSTTTVDLSKTALRWAQHHLTHNGVAGPQHRLVWDDVLNWLEAQADSPAAYDLALVNPPTFSNSKRMEDTFDVLRDHELLLRATLACMRPGGIVIFSSHAKRLTLAPSLAADFQVKEAHRLVRPIDFDRPARGCRAFTLSQRA